MGRVEAPIAGDKEDERITEEMERPLGNEKLDEVRKDIPNEECQLVGQNIEGYINENESQEAEFIFNSVGPVDLNLGPSGTQVNEERDTCYLSPNIDRPRAKK